MKTVAEMLKPRENVFKDTAREDVLNLSDFAEHTIDAEKFFAENFRTEGMKVLFDTAFSRFRGESNTGVIKLTQAMGGGKTHNMLALALLAENIELRKKICGESAAAAGEIKVAAFSGRENADFGIWGVIAEQLGKREFFKDYYSPLKAPGESAWVRLLEGEKVLILLDELPPYLENAKSITVGNSDLSKVTATALSNLFVAIGKAQLANVCLVFSDLKAAYESGSNLLQSSFKELEQEANRVALDIAPVNLNTDEIFSILKKRLFEDSSDYNYAEEINDIAKTYKSCVEYAKKSGFTNYQPETVFRGIAESYPFHPSIRDLYARFKENQGFQQTRGLIKLMRQIVRQFYESKKAENSYLINAFDFDLNDERMFSFIRQIKPSLDEAISHDIAHAGNSAAETIDAELAKGNNAAQNIAKLLLMSSLSTVPHGLLGLNESEIFGFISQPECDLNDVKTALTELKGQCWYMKPDNLGRLFFQNTKNMIAEMNTLVESYTNENVKKELKEILSRTFAPKTKTCYDILYVLPAVDEICLDTNKISLVIFEPHAGSGLNPDLQQFYDSVSQKNRVMFLSGQRDVMEKLYLNSKKLKAMQQIVSNMKEEGISGTDQQYKEAEAQLDKALQALYSAIRETFVTLYYPTKNGIEAADLRLEFKNNSFNGEEQIINCLSEVRKYEKFSKEDMFLENLRKKCEARLFTVKELPYSQIKERAASNPIWQWFHPDQLDALKNDCIKRDIWRETGGYLVKGPFEKEPTEVIVKQSSYNELTEEFTVYVKGIGGKVYYSTDSKPTEFSKPVAENILVTGEPLLYFICIDPDGERKIGNIVEFLGKVPLKYGQRMASGGRIMEISTHSAYTVYYTTDGSEPKENGRIYSGEFNIPDNCKFVRTAVYYKDKLVEEKNIPIDTDEDTEVQNIDSERFLLFRYKHKKVFDDTASSYSELLTLSRLKGVFIKGASAYIYSSENENDYMEISAGVSYWADDLRALIDLVRDTSFKETEVTVIFEYKELLFDSGELFEQWIDINRLDLNYLRRNGEIIQ